MITRKENKGRAYETISPEPLSSDEVLGSLIKESHQV